MREDVEATVIVVVEVNDESAVTRCVENLDDSGGHTPGRGFRDLYYDLETREAVLRHLAFNCIANGVTDARQLDGWADLPHGAVTMELDRMVDFL